MEYFEFNYPSANRRVTGRAHVGVVSSGDMEVLVEALEGPPARVSILTSVQGSGGDWNAVLDRFFAKHPKAVRIHINDAGATPGTASLRLQQALEDIEE